MQRRATYRLQLRPEFGFSDAAAQADYLADLGVSHVYTSPYLQAARGSTHGYDVVDPTRVSDDLGGPEGHRRFVDALGAQGLQQLLDIVPNHMSISDRRNRWWWDVLADGLSSPFAGFFDIDWDVDEPGLNHRVLLPVLGDQVGRVLEAGEITLVREGGEILIAYFANRYPVRVETTGEILAVAGADGLSPALSAISSLPAGDSRESRRERCEQRARIAEMIAAVLEREPHTATAVDRVLHERNRDVAALDHVLAEQHHRLARWQTAVEEVNYRRFFDINTLAALRVEEPEVFEAVTGLVAGMVRRGEVDGLRIDHIDGLRRPLEYAARLREATDERAWLLAEKILARGEQPPPWPLDGTSGYDFLAVASGLFVDPKGMPALEALYVDITGDDPDFERVARAGKREILGTTLVSDVERLTNLLATVVHAYPAHRDHTRSELTGALVELIAAVPVYRTYVDPARGAASDVDAGIIRGAALRAQAERPDLDPRLFHLIADLFVFGEAEDVATTEDAHTRAAKDDLVLRLQQLCAATTAKGVEDTAFYRHLVLASLNEVGGSPAHGDTSVDEFHRFNETTLQRRPQALLATSTHDTKRSEDVRARLHLLSEMPAEWETVVRRWMAMTARHRRDELPDRAMEYLLYQTLVGAWPIDADRLVAYMQKASREAKRHTSWLQPNAEYDAALAAFARSVLGDEQLVADVTAVVAGLTPYARINSLATVLLKLTSPGIPDIYQGTELWDLSLVDPDNRRPVDYEARRRLLARVRADGVVVAWAAGDEEGVTKLGLVSAALALRARRADAFAAGGGYEPLRAAGAFADDVVAFTRGEPRSVISLVQRRALRRRGTWGDTVITLPDGPWRNVLDGSTRAGTVDLAALLAEFPVALLETAS